MGGIASASPPDMGQHPREWHNIIGLPFWMSSYFQTCTAPCHHSLAKTSCNTSASGPVAAAPKLAAEPTPLLTVRAFFVFEIASTSEVFDPRTPKWGDISPINPRHTLTTDACHDFTRHIFGFISTLQQLIQRRHFAQTHGTCWGWPQCAISALSSALALAKPSAKRSHWLPMHKRHCRRPEYTDRNQHLNILHFMASRL